ncbi:sulfotransferase [Algiphilus sp.]|uniref:sulfotransferase family protein n=1 Tax=Algiphilus sp. TaxID=1872431 RepID=UPI0032EDDAFC
MKPASRALLPTFVVMGAQKSGTTSLHKALAAHSDVFMSHPLKEPGFFMGPRGRHSVLGGTPSASLRNRALLRQSMLRGYSGERHFGESSTYYTMGGRAERWRIPQRMHRLNRNLRFIYVLRDPLGRIHSNYLHARRRGSVGPGFTEFLAHPEGKSAVLTSCYFRQLRSYLRFFPPERFHIVIMEELLEDPDAELQKALAHIGAPEDALPADFPALNVASNRKAERPKEEREVIPEPILQTLREDAQKLYQWLGRRIPAWRPI